MTIEQTKRKYMLEQYQKDLDETLYANDEHDYFRLTVKSDDQWWRIRIYNNPFDDKATYAIAEHPNQKVSFKISNKYYMTLDDLLEDVKLSFKENNLDAPKEFSFSFGNDSICFSSIE